MLDNQCTSIHDRLGTYVQQIAITQSAISRPVSADGTTALPTFMPVATQAALKGLSQQQTEELGISNNLFLSFFVEI
jgi:hypothetical protein